MEETQLIDSIATAQMEQEIGQKVIHIAKQNAEEMAKETGVLSSLHEEHMREYLHDVLLELSDRKNKNSIRDKQ